MTSGLRWNEAYGEPNSDVARLNQHTARKGSTRW
ncbi:MAG: hypothetical protein JWP65_3186 [Ramlibacter sp.]|nr:hypothetical protein [Ramlibacter sp.]